MVHLAKPAQDSCHITAWLCGALMLCYITSLFTYRPGNPLPKAGTLRQQQQKTLNSPKAHRNLKTAKNMVLDVGCSDGDIELERESETLSLDTIQKFTGYLEGLEARILQLESGNKANSKALGNEKEEKDNDDKTDEKDEQEETEKDEEDKQEEEEEEDSGPRYPYDTIQFVPKLHNVTGRGTDASSWRSSSIKIKNRNNPRLISAFCVSAKRDAAQLLSLDDNLPKLEDIDLLAFAVWSEPIVDFVVKELGASVDRDHEVVYFEKPFKTIIRSVAQLKEHLEGLKRRYGRVEVKAVNRTSSPEASPPETSDAAENREASGALPLDETEDDTLETFNRPSAISHFQGLLDFVHNYLGPQLALFKRFREGTEKAVAFENLWMLFDTYDTIYCPMREAGQISIGTKRHKAISRHTPQAYRVLATTGGTPLTSTMVHRPQPKLVMSFSQQPPLPTTQGSGAAAVGGAGYLADYLGPEAVSQSGKARNSYTPLYVFCFYIDFNGLEFGTVCDTFEFKPYEQEISIRDLKVFPLIYAPPKFLVDRGKKFVDATNVAHMEYRGMTVGHSREEINSSVVVDMKLAYESDPITRYESITRPTFVGFANNWFELEADCAKEIFGWTCSVGCCLSSDKYLSMQEKVAEKAESEVKALFEEYEDRMKSQGKKGFEDFKVMMESKGLITLLPGAVPGFSLRNRRWVLLDIMRLTPVEQNNEWKNLVLPKGHRQMVQAMVETHTRELSLGGKEGSEKIGMDLVRGKGKGCIILLHGVPGVGKTSTAVFLRILEYYNGILFLTTNRVGAIDDAFRSRLHLTLYYPKLTEKQTIKIFKRNFERIGEINEARRKNNLPEFQYEKSQKKVISWAKRKWETLRWNGRQIRNTFQTAMALAEFHAKDADGNSKTPVLSKKYFNIVATASEQFNKYLVAVHGMDEERVAKRDLIRALPGEYDLPIPAPDLDFEDSISDSSDSSSEQGSDDGDSGTSSDCDSDTSNFSEDEKNKKKGKYKGRKGKSSSSGNIKVNGKTSSKKYKKGKSGKDGKKDRKRRGESDSDEED
ncbi:hypothetical protein DL765_000926 [Monosporascus sp. GIB2]|nr:hypothetical protein DL765_000926 [Monosporascus sp. GIB2]